MRISVLQHVPFEDIASMADEFNARRYQVTTHHLYRGDPLPATDDFDWLVVMGGPMSVGDTRDHPWIGPEQQLIANAIAGNKRVLGICLGAQLIASALGARVVPGQHREIGWHPLQGISSHSVYASLFSDNPTVFHWHGDTFTLPQGAVQLARSEACEQQAFAIGQRVLALQFHVETNPDSARAILANCSAELDGSRFVQPPETIAGTPEQFAAIHRLMGQMIEIMADDKP